MSLSASGKVDLINFLSLLKDYGVVAQDSEIARLLALGTEPISVESETTMPPIKRPDRDVKIRRYREEKDLKDKLSVAGSIDHVPNDDDDKRSFFELELKLWKLKAVAELESILEELPLAKMMEERSQTAANGQPVSPPPVMHSTTASTSVPRGFILTGTEAQKRVFGKGYPSLPTMTVEEWCDQQIEKGRIDLSGANKPPPPKETGDDEGKTEEELEEKRKKEQQWDEYTDDHRRGWGNTYKRG